MTVHETWSMYAGNSDQLICNVKRTVPSRMDNQSIPSMDVFLAANAAEVMPDFQLTGNYLQRNLMLLCRGRTLAQVHPILIPNFDSCWMVVLLTTPHCREADELIG